MTSSLQAIRSFYSHVYVIVSPPRCSSTAFARVFWEHPTVRYYCHEPFEVTYYDGASLDAVVEKLNQPLDLAPIKQAPTTGNRLIIKEMPYQVWDNFPLLAEIAVRPIIFLMRDPRLNISSRITMKRIANDNPLFRFVESGWDLLEQHINTCRANDIPYLIVDANDFRNQPRQVFPEIFEAVGLDFSPSQLTWAGHNDVELDNLGGKHRHLYERVLTSDGMQPTTEPIPPLSAIPPFYHDHLSHCLEIYARLREDANRVRPSSKRTAESLAI